MQFGLFTTIIVMKKIFGIAFFPVGVVSSNSLTRSYAVLVVGLCLSASLGMLGCSEKSPPREGRTKQMESNLEQDSSDLTIDTEDPEAGTESEALLPLPPDEPCYLDQDLEKLTLELHPVIGGDKASFISWSAPVVLAHEDFDFVLDTDREDLEPPTVLIANNKRRRKNLFEQILWVCAEEDRKGYPPRHPESCHEALVETLGMSLTIGISGASGDEVKLHMGDLELGDLVPDGTTGDSGSSLALTLTKEKLGWPVDQPMRARHLKTFDFSWKIKFSAADGKTAIRNKYLDLKNKEGESISYIGHIPAAFPHLKAMVIRGDDHAYPLWRKSLGGLYYKNPAGFFKKTAPTESDAAHSGTYTLTHEWAKYSDTTTQYNYYENPFTHHFVDQDVTLGRWYKNHHQHCDTKKENDDDGR